MPIVPEIDEEHGLCGPKIPQPLPHMIPLPRRGHHGNVGIPPNRNVIEVPHEDTSLFHQKIDELVAGQHIGVKPRLGGGNGEKQTRIPQKIHHPNIPCEPALSPSRIGMFLEPL